MAKDVVTIKNESLKTDEDSNCRRTVIDSQLPKETSFDFQKKLTLSKHEKQDTDSSSVLGNNEACKQLLGILQWITWKENSYLLLLLIH